MPKLFLLERICLERFVSNSRNNEATFLVKSGTHLKAQTEIYLFDILVGFVSVVDVDRECILQSSKPLYKLINVK